jgi:hypothetical protein
MGLGSADDVVKLQAHNPECRDVDTIIKLHEKGLLDQETASELSREAIGLDACHANKRVSREQPHEHLALRSPRASTAPSEAGAQEDA